MMDQIKWTNNRRRRGERPGPISGGLSILIAVITASSSSAAAAEPMNIQHDRGLPQAAFAAAEIRQALAASAHAAGSIRLTLDASLGAQAYAISRDGAGVLVRGGDARGLMYGGLEVAEQIRVPRKVDAVQNVSGRPHVLRRGLKFNIPLDIRTPSYQDAGDAAQNNIAEMWNFEFWQEYLDHMARFRYNVLTLWNPHPFPSMILLADYPDIALRDVHGTAFPLDTDRPDESVAKFIAGSGISQSVLDRPIVLKRLSMPEKIDFWRRVMRYAKDRGIDVYFITWNIWMNGIAPPGWYREQKLKTSQTGKYGINNNQDNPRTIAYLRASVKQFLLTYPDVAGIGFTAGENMEDRSDAYDREKWLWATYGLGVMDALKVQPERRIEIIHRVWQSGMPRIMQDFVRHYPGEVNLSFKYSKARMYSTPTPPWATDFVRELRQFGARSWWNIRNDDIFHFRWGDPGYVSAFIKNLPAEGVTAGYYMGSDGYVWGRESISIHPNHPRELEISKHWFNFMLWGRLGYDPNLDVTRIKALLQLRHPEVPVEQLYAAWTAASRIIPLVNRFHWKDWDFMWAVEGCLDLRKGFHTVRDFINTPTMQGANLLSIPEFVKLRGAEKGASGQSPLDVAAQLDQYAGEALQILGQSRTSGTALSKELSELLYDIEAMSFLGKYYAGKIRGATHLHAFAVTGDEGEKTLAINALEEAVEMWRGYARAATCNYRPQFLAKTRTIDWVHLTDEVRRDIEIARAATATPERRPQ